MNNDLVPLSGTPPYLWQAHHQHPDGTSQMCSQFEASTEEELLHELHGARDKFPLPEGAVWMWCTPGSPDFVMAAP